MDFLYFFIPFFSIYFIFEIIEIVSNRVLSAFIEWNSLFVQGFFFKENQDLLGLKYGKDKPNRSWDKNKYYLIIKRNTSAEKFYSIDNKRYPEICKKIEEKWVFDKDLQATMLKNSAVKIIIMVVIPILILVLKTTSIL